MGSDVQRLSVRQANNISLGQGGCTFINDTVANTSGASAKWVAISCIEDTVFTLLTNDAGMDGDSIAAEIFPKGFVLYGLFSAITLASGAVVAYKTSEWEVS